MKNFISPTRAQSTRGQVTLEWLMLGLVALALLAIAAMALSRAQEAQTTLSEQRVLQLQVEELGYYADQICVLGEGNARMVTLSSQSFELRYENGGLNMSMGKHSASRSTICPIEADLDRYRGQAYLRFKRDPNDEKPMVSITNQP